MPIAKGEEWGTSGVLPPDAPVVSSDAAAAALVAGKHGVIGIDDGDLARTLGIRKPYDRSAPKQLVPVDAVRIELDDGSSRLCIAHAVVGNLLTSSYSVALMNAAFIGKRNIAPRAHPGDGKVDVVEFRLTLPDRLKAWQRMATASHLPHPGIAVRRVTADELEFGRSLPVSIDGRACGRSRTLNFTVVPEAIVIAAS